jgi:hypothetical protein
MIASYAASSLARCDQIHRGSGRKVSGLDHTRSAAALVPDLGDNATARPPGDRGGRAPHTAGATVIRVDVQDGTPDHVVMADPEGNEVCVL